MKVRSIDGPRQANVVTVLIVCLIFFSFVLVKASHAASAKGIDVKVDFALEFFKNEVNGGQEFLKGAKGVLVIPRIIKAGLVLGGEYGEGALRVGGKTVDYYSVAAGSFGFQLGIQEKNIIIVFMEDEALKKFRGSPGWKAGADGSIVLTSIGVGGFTDTMTAHSSIVTYVFGQRGLMFNVTLEGAKFTKLRK